MNCDQVFDVLTRGPFPTGAESDDAVERHLAHCGECGRLAAALRPAIELFEEAVDPEESRGLPSYWGEVCATPGDFAIGRESNKSVKLAVPAVRSRRARVVSRRTSSGGLLFTGAALMGVMLAAAVHYGMPRDGSAHAGGLDMLRSLKPGQVCLTPAASITAPLVAPPSIAPQTGDELSLAALACCLECHAPDDQQAVGQDAVLRIGRSCQVCHL